MSAEQPTSNPHAQADAPAEFRRGGASGEVEADLTPFLKRLLAGETLSAEETTRAFEAMMTGRVHHGEVGALLALCTSICCRGGNWCAVTNKSGEVLSTWSVSSHAR